MPLGEGRSLQHWMRRPREVQFRRSVTMAEVSTGCETVNRYASTNFHVWALVSRSFVARGLDVTLPELVVALLGFSWFGWVRLAESGFFSGR
eukprot:1345855-Rhodomonas_salina.2